MNEIVEVTPEQVGDKTIQTVDARELHEFLEVNSKFADWIKNRVDKFEFAEGSDYVTLSKNLEGGGLTKEYHISIDMAKELSMVENNAKGREARKYFIEAESKYKVVLSELEKSKMSAQIFMDIVRPNEATKLMLVHNICKKHGLPMDMIPQYAAGRATFSMTALAKKFNIKMSVQAINKKLIEKGILAELSRKSTTKGEKKFLSVTEAGKEYGENLTSPRNPLETQPHWFEDKFHELMELVKAAA